MILWLLNLLKKKAPVKEKELPKTEAPINNAHKILVGIDIFWRDQISDWKLLAGKIDYMFIKSTEGDFRDDPKFTEFRNKAKENGIPCGAYHFYRSNKSPEEQAKDFIRVVGQINPGELPPVCDWETEDDLEDGKDIEEVQKFLNIIEAHFGVTPIIYSGSYFASDKQLPKSFARYPLWLAHYTKGNPRIPKPWEKYCFWQITDKAQVAGVKNPCDCNYFLGTREDLSNLCKK